MENFELPHTYTEEEMAKNRIRLDEEEKRVKKALKKANIADRFDLPEDRVN